MSCNLVKLQSCAGKCYKIRKIEPRKICEFCIFVLRTEDYHFSANGHFSWRHTNIRKLCEARFFVFYIYNICQPNFAILLILTCSFQLAAVVILFSFTGSNISLTCKHANCIIFRKILILKPGFHIS